MLLILNIMKCNRPYKLQREGHLSKMACFLNLYQFGLPKLYQSSCMVHTKKRSKITRNIGLDLGKWSEGKDITSQNSNQDSWYCNICDIDKEENMIQCIQCHQWHHSRCAGVKSNAKIYYCSTCKGTLISVKRHKSSL